MTTLIHDNGLWNVRLPDGTLITFRAEDQDLAHHLVYMQLNPITDKGLQPQDKVPYDLDMEVEIQELERMATPIEAKSAEVTEDGKIITKIAILKSDSAHSYSEGMTTPKDQYELYPKIKVESGQGESQEEWFTRQLNQLYAECEHGDDEHRKWLKDKFEDFKTRVKWAEK